MFAYAIRPIGSRALRRQCQGPRESCQSPGFSPGVFMDKTSGICYCKTAFPFVNDVLKEGIAKYPPGVGRRTLFKLVSMILAATALSCVVLAQSSYVNF